MSAPEIQHEREGQRHYSDRRYDKALECLQGLYALGRTDPQLKIYEAQCLYYLRRAPEAIAIMRELHAADPEHPDFNILLAQYLRATGDFEESLRYLEHVPEDFPGYAMLMGWHRLRTGDFLGGSRMLQKESGVYQIDDRFKFPKEKRLQRGMDIRGKTILLGMYGGFGDEIASVRFAPLLEGRGARVIVGSSQPRLIGVLKDIAFIREVRDNSTLTHTEYDYYMPSIDAIDFLEIEHPSRGIAFPYLTADGEETARWASVIAREAGKQKKIGIHWQGNWEFDSTEMKSPPAALMARFAECGRIFSFQRDAGENTLPDSIDYVDIEAGPPSWKSTVAAMSQMDYMVTNDSSTAHIAGALGIKTAVLLLHAPHHYWLPLDMESAWYPTLRLFRQPTYNSWEGAVLSASLSIQKDSGKPDLTL